MLNKMFSISFNLVYGILINLILFSLQNLVFIESLCCVSLKFFSPPNASTGSKCCLPSYSIHIFSSGK